MDVICTKCAEPWELDYVMHDAPEEFKKEHAIIFECPSCKGTKPTLDNATQSILANAVEVGHLLGDDVDGYAAMLEDLGLT